MRSRAIFRFSWKQRFGTIISYDQSGKNRRFGRRPRIQLKSECGEFVVERGLKPSTPSLRTQKAKLDGTNLNGMELEEGEDPTSSGNSE
jgi:hypothetical protein